MIEDAGVASDRETQMILSSIERVERSTEMQAARLEAKLEEHRRDVAANREVTSKKLAEIQDQVVELKMWRSWFMGITAGLSFAAVQIWEWIRAHLK